MTTLTYILFVIAGSVFGGILGAIAHFWRAHATPYAEDLGLGETMNSLTRDDYAFERHVVGAEWDEAGFWDAASVRNLVYYVVSGAAAPLALGVFFFGQRESMVGLVCRGLTHAGLHSPFCS